MTDDKRQPAVKTIDAGELGELTTTAVGPVPINTATRLLEERRIIDKTRLVFDIKAGATGWAYNGPYGGTRFKAYNSQADTKYCWLSEKPAYEFYHSPDIQDAIETNGGVVYYVSGEPDVWAAHSSGIENVFSAYSERGVPETFVPLLQSWGVVLVCIFPDLDATGERWARKVAGALQDSGIELDARRLPQELGNNGDLGKAWQHYTRRLPFERYLLGLPQIDIEPELPPTPKPVPAGDVTDIPAEYRQLVADALGVTGYGSDHFSRHNVHCPFHDDRHPDASLHELKGLFCHPCGRWYTWSETAVKLGLESYHDWRLAHPEPRRAPLHQLSTEVREALISKGLTTTARLLDALYSAGLKPGDSFTVAQAVQLCEPYGLSQWAIYRALNPQPPKTKNQPAGDLLRFFLPFSLQHSQPAKTAKKSIKGRPAQAFKMPGPDEVGRELGVNPAKWAHHDKMPAPMLRKAKLYRAEVYAALPRRKPGNYARKTLAGRLGVCPRTAYTYDKYAELSVSPRFERVELEQADLEQLPEERKDAAPNVWLEDSKGRRYQPTKRGAAYALQYVDKLWRVEQLANHYGPGKGKDGA